MRLWRLGANNQDIFREVKKQRLTYKRISGSKNLYYLYEKLCKDEQEKPLALLSLTDTIPTIDLIDRARESKLGKMLRQYYPISVISNNPFYSKR